jgi:LysM repeat protein
MALRTHWAKALAGLVLGLLWLYAARPAYADTIYVVQPGDNLYRIALRFGVSQPVLMAANGLTNPSRVYVGQRLVIPGASAPVAAATVEPTGVAMTTATPPPATPSAVTSLPGIYVVQPGDTLHRISLKFGISQSALMQLNGLVNPNRLAAGQTLRLPGGAAEATPEITAAAPVATLAPTVAAASGTYVVRPGDSLWSLAQRFGVSVGAIQQANHLASGWLYTGQTLVMPGAPAAAGPQLAVPTLPAGEAARPASLPPWIPVITAHMRQIYADSPRQGHNPNLVTVVGDCNSEYPLYFGPVSAHMLDLTDYGYLNATINHFSASFLRHSLAAHGGFNAGSMMDPAWADPTQCERGEGPMACELRASHASLVFIGLGTGDQFTWRDFEVHYRSLIDYALSRGVLPVLVTKADVLESLEGGAEPGYINGVIRRLGQEYDVPVLDFWLAVRDLPNGGLLPEGGHDFHLNAAGIGRHIMATLQTLDVIWR